MPVHLKRTVPKRYHWFESSSRRQGRVSEWLKLPSWNDGARKRAAGPNPAATANRSVCERLKQVVSKATEQKCSDGSNPSASAKYKTMNSELHHLRSKPSPALTAPEQSCAGVAQLAEQPTLTRKAVGSLPIARTKYATAAVGVVVIPACPCGEQQVNTRVWQNGDALVLHSSNGGSIPSTRTNRMRSAASESRQPTHAGVMVRLISHKDLVMSSSLISGTKLRQRKRMDTLQLCQHGLMEGHSVSTGKNAGSSPAAGAK